MIGFVALALSVIVIGFVFFAYSGGRGGGGGDAHQIYRDQLDEVERDAGRGLINAAEAVDARVEIQRRLLRDAAPVKATSGGPMVPRLLLVIAPVLAAALRAAQSGRE